ncbi:MAG: tetratricopeptide repeat protein [Deltaproteobacteria bacterium]|nr:tetratricopeptide repeat protein [Deltaproteobacteria bacterium]
MARELRQPKLNEQGRESILKQRGPIRPVASTEKYLAWHLDGTGRHVGDWALPMSMSPGQYVELGRDSAGVLVEIREYVEGHAEPLVRWPRITRGRVEDSEYRDPVTGLAGRNSYEYDAKGCLRARQEVDERGTLRFRVEVECDSRSRIVRQRLFDRRGKLKERIDYAYDEQGRRNREAFFKDSAGAEATGHVERRFDGRDAVLEQSWFGASGEKLNTFHYQTDGLGRVVEIRLVREGVTSLVTSIEFDGEGKRRATVIRDGEGGEVSREGGAEAGRPVTRAGEEPSGPAGIGAEAARSLVHAAYFYFEKGQLDRARELFETVATVLPDDAYAAKGVAATAAAQGKHQTALNWFDRALARDPDDVEALAGRGEALFLLGRAADALESYQRLFAGAPRDTNHPAIRRATVILEGLLKAIDARDGKARQP